MLFAVICRDKPDHLPVRLENREAHLAYVRDTGVVEQAGPLLDGEGQMCGSLLVLEVPDMAAAEAEIRRLRRELAIAQEEREILKKAVAIFAPESR